MSPQWRASLAAAPVFAFGFRPFFLAAGLWSCLALALSVASLAGGLVLPTDFAGAGWHAHEMLYGFAGAAVAGFFLTAVANWTGRPPLQGGALLALLALWLAARLFNTISALTGPTPGAVFDLTFLAALLAFALRELFNAASWRNLPLAFALLALLLGCAASHAEAAGLGVPDAGFGGRLGIAILVLLITLIGGRIVPAFTRNWLVSRGSAALPAPAGYADAVVLVITLLALGLWVASPGPVASPLLAAAALANAWRLSRWQGHRTLAEPLLVVLHVGYAWVPLGMALLSAALVAPQTLPVGAAVHGLTSGAIGTMILAVMTRATLGHTGRALRAGWVTSALYVLVTVAALARIAAALLPDAYNVPLLHAAGAAWVAAFAGFVAVYGPMLLRPRVDGKPG